MPEPVPKTMLVMHLAGIGDLLMGLPALQALRERFPASRIILLTWRKAQDAARLIPTVDERYTFDERAHPSALAHNLATVASLRRLGVDLAINLYQVYRWIGVAKLACLLRLIAPTHTAGRDTDGKGLLFDLRVHGRSSDSQLQHEVERQLALTTHLGCAPPRANASLTLDAADGTRVERWLLDAGVKPDERLISIHPGGARASHRWPWQSFATVAYALEARGAGRIVLTGSADERGLAERIARRLAWPVVAAGEFSLGELAWMFRRCQLVIANDSGPMHLAASLRVPLVAISGPTDPKRYGPYPLARPDQVILHPGGCAPCYRDRCGGHAALEELPINTVLEAAESILSRRHPTGLIDVRRRLRVLHVHTLPVISGSGINTYLSMCGQRDAGFQVELASAPPQTAASDDTGGDLAALVQRGGMRFLPVSHLMRSIHPWHDLCACIQLWRLIRRGRYDIVHTHNSKAGFVGRLAARLAGVPVVIHTVHGFAFHAREPWWTRLLYRVLEQVAARWCDRLVMISQPLVDWARQERIAPHEKLVKIYSGIDLEAFRQPVDVASVRDALGLTADAFVVGEVAKLWPGKGHDVLFRAAAALKDRLPSLRLLIVGEGNLRASLTRLAQELGIQDRVVLTGFRTDVPALTQVFDVAVLPTLFEGMGRAVLEAQAAGKPVVASRVGGIPDLITDGVSGILVEPGNAQPLADAIWRLYTQPALRRQLGETARQALDGRFEAGTMSEQLIQLYRELLSVTHIERA